MNKCSICSDESKRVSLFCPGLVSFRNFTHPFCLGWGVSYHMGMDQYLYIPFLGGWTSIYQLFWCSPGVQGFDTLPYNFESFLYGDRNRLGEQHTLIGQDMVFIKVGHGPKTWCPVDTVGSWSDVIKSSAPKGWISILTHAAPGSHSKILVSKCEN